LSNGVFEKSEGAVVYKPDNESLHTRVFLNSLGLPTYEAKELSLAFKKQEFVDYDLSVIVTGNEIREYFQVLLEALSRVDASLADKTKHLPHGMLRLTSGKMSSRTGQVIAGMDLVNDVVQAIKREYGKDLSDADLFAIAVGAIKIMVLKQGVGSDVVFDNKKSIELSGDTGPYIQYAAVRAMSILKAAEISGQDLFDFKDVTLNADEARLAKQVLWLPEVVQMAVSSMSVNYLTNYLFDLARAFNNFYDGNKVLGSDKQDLRLALVRAAYIRLEQVLGAMGIRIPQKM
jgi:arginyl-tRNA synthetase